MAETNQEYIDQLITFIENTNDPDSITNVMVAVIFAFLNNRCKSLQTSQTETADNLTAEATVRSSADNELRAAIALLRRALDESEDGTFAPTVREDIRDIFDALTMLRDDQKLSQEDIDQIKADIESILGENASEAIENFNEILNFLEGVKDTDSLLGLLDNIRQTTRDIARDLQSHEDNDKTHINVLSLADEEDLDDATGMHVRPGLYRIRLGVDATQPDRDGDMFLFNVWGRWDYTVSVEGGTRSVPVYRMKIDREGVWVQSGTYNSDNLYSHGQWQSLTSLLLTVKTISDTKADRTELSNILGTPTKEEIENIEPGIVTTVLRKTPQTLTPEEQAQVKANLAISKMELFCDLFNAAARDYGYARITDGQFDCLLNGLSLTYEEAVVILKNNQTRPPYPTTLTDAKTNIFISNTSVGSAFTLHTEDKMFTHLSKMEVIRIARDDQRAMLTSRMNTFSYNSKLRTVLGVIDLSIAQSTPHGMFYECFNLENICLIVKESLYLAYSPKLSLDSFRHIVTYAVNTSAITITVHPDVYAKLTDEANTDWHQILLDAADKNITFATV